MITGGYASIGTPLFRTDFEPYCQGMSAPECPRLSGCPFFNNKFKNMPAAAEMAKKSYCRSSQYEDCARYIVAQALGVSAVPDNLYPDQVDRAHALIVSK